MAAEDNSQRVVEDEKAAVASEGGRDLLRALLICLIAVVVVRSFVVEPFKIPSSSMVPTLRIGDRIFVTKFAYGLSLPFSKIEFLRFGAPERGDVIVFLSPRDESLHYVKRVLGVPGDEIEFRGQELFINGSLVQKSQIDDTSLMESFKSDAEGTGVIYREDLFGRVHYVRHSRAAFGESSRPGQVERVPADHFFVVGDNRDESYDSRSWGFVPRENVKGKAVMVWLSLKSDDISSGSSSMRWDRCGTLIH